MPKDFELEGHGYELDVTRTENIKCRVWESEAENSNIVVYAYGYGMNSEHEEIEALAEGIVQKYNTSVVVVEYTGTNLKYSDDLLIKLEKFLPNLLQNTCDYLPQKVQSLIKERRYQDAINDLYFNAFARYPLNENTIIPLYGDLNIYNDFGLTPALDIIYALQNLKKIYPCWNWDDCIGYGKQYGAYLIEMAEKLSPGTFSMVINVKGNVMPLKEDIFYNMTEWKHGNQKNCYINHIGRFQIYLADMQGWTSNKEHPFSFCPRHFDIRNLLNENIVESNFMVKETPRIYVDLFNLQDSFLDYRKKYMDLLIQNEYSMEYFLVEEEDIDNKIFKEKGNKIEIDLLSLYDYYLKEYPNRNTRNKEKLDFVWYPVNNGAYVIYDLQQLPKMIYMDNEMVEQKNKEVSNLLDKYGCENENVKKLLRYLKTPIDIIDDEYIKLRD